MRGEGTNDDNLFILGTPHVGVTVQLKIASGPPTSPLFPTFFSSPQSQDLVDKADVWRCRQEDRQGEAKASPIRRGEGYGYG